MDEVWQIIAEQETLNLRTVGIDIGSSTSHLTFSQVRLQREQHGQSSRFLVIGRTVEWESPITFTPFRSDGLIDASALARFVRTCYEEAGRSRADVDSGAVILTGEAAKRANARAIDEALAREAGAFVCATAGHRLEGVLAAHGSGATALSRARAACGLHVDIGGGTTKLVLIDHGEIVDAAAIAVGGRALARSDQGADQAPRAGAPWTRIDEPVGVVARALGLTATPTTVAEPLVRARITYALAGVVIAQIAGDRSHALTRALELTPPLRYDVLPEYLTFSGGVSEYLLGHTSTDHGDIARDLAAAIRTRLPPELPVIDPGQRIRATAIGAAQFTVQVSGKTTYLDRDCLPLRNLPVVRLAAPEDERLDAGKVAAAIRAAAARADRDLAGPVALAFAWPGLPLYERIATVATGILEAISDRRELRGGTVAPGNATSPPLVLIIDGDVGRTFGRVLTADLKIGRPVVSIDGITLHDLDFVDIGECCEPPGVVPIVIKSLLFDGPT